jgi:clan AA aspartic protease
MEIGDPQGRTWEPVTAVVDTGSTYSWVPADVLGRLGVEREYSEEFETADDRVIARDVGHARVRIEGRTRITLVVFGDEGSVPLLGAYTLEGFLLAVDPVHQRLVPVRGLAK